MAAKDDPIIMALDWLGISFTDTRQPRADYDAEQRERRVGGGLVGGSQDDPDASDADDDAKEPLYDQQQYPTRGMNLLIGIEAEHDNELATNYLEHLFAWFNTCPDAPLLCRSIQHDCMVAPPERGGRHWELIRFTW